MTGPNLTKYSSQLEIIPPYSNTSNYDEFTNESNFLPFPGVSMYLKYRWRTEAERNFILEFYLVKHKVSEVSKTLRMSIDISVYKKDGTILAEFKKYDSVNVHQMKDIKFQEFSIPFSNSRRTLVIKYCLKFSNVDPLKRIPSQNKAYSQSKNGLKLFNRNFSSAYELGVFCDVQFIIGDNTLPAHKFILAAHSPVFMRMLTSDFKESQTNTITIKDTSYEVFSGFLKYLYSGEVLNPTWVHVSELYVLADKYDVAVLKHECHEMIPSLLNMVTVCDILILAFSYDDCYMKKVAIQYACDNIKCLLIRSDQWKALMKSHPQIGYEVMSLLVPTE